MGLTLADSYYLKAKAAIGEFCSDWEEVCEALNYALSYDENHCASLCLLGEIYAKYLSMPDKAFECFDSVIAIDTNYEDVFPMYIKYLISNNKIDRAGKLITFSESVESIDKAQIYWLSSYIEETLGNYEACLEDLKEAQKYCYNNHYFDFMIDEQKRIRKKMKLDKKQKPSKKSKKRKKSKKK